MDSTRLVLLIVFCGSLFLLGQRWVESVSPRPVVQAAANVEPGRAATPVPAAASVPQSGAATAAAPGGAPPAAQAAPTVGQQVEVETDLLRARIDTRGGDLVHLELLDHGDPEEPTRPLVLFTRSAEHTYLAQSGLIGPGLPNHTTAWTVVDAPRTLGAGEDTLTVRLRADAGAGPIDKFLTFKRGSYLIETRFLGAAPLAEGTSAYFQVIRDDKPAPGEARFVSTFIGGAYYTDADRYTKLDFKDIRNGKVKLPLDVTDGWIGMVQHYFAAAWIVPGQVRREFFAKPLDGGLYAVGTIVGAQGGEIAMPLYAGPEEQDKVAAIAPGLDLTADYGMLKIIAQPLFWVLSTLESMVGNWGVAIILLTIGIKLIFFPLSAASYRSMAKMRMVGPKLQKLKEIHGDDRVAMNKAMMELYRTEKINPLGGCLPIVVQIPVFFALYWVLLGSVELRQAPFYGWIHDLSRPDPWFILPVLMAISMLVQTRLNPEPPDPIQAKVMKIMPIAFSVFFFFSPAGLVLYWFVNNLLSIGQQWVITRNLEQRGAAAGPRR